MKYQILATLLLLIVVSSCIAEKGASPEISSTASITKETSQLIFTPTLETSPFTITLEINQDYSQEKLANVLFSKWLDTFLSNDINLEKRIDKYAINEITISANQECAKKLDGLFVTEANISMQTALPLISTTDYKHSDWVAGGGNIEDAKHITKLFTGIIFKSGNRYTLNVIMQIPTC